MNQTTTASDQLPVTLGHQELSEIRLPDGVQIPMRYWPGAPERGIVVFLHGLLSHSGWFIPTGNWLQERGFTCLALDRRGSGRSTETRGHMHAYQQLVDEIEGALDWLDRRHPGAPVHLTGQCYGALPVLRYAAQHPQRLRSLTVLSPSIRVHATINLREKLMVAMLAKLLPRYRMRVPLKPEDFTDLPEQLEFIRNDALRLNHVTTAFYLETLMMMIRVRRSARHITTPLFMALAGRDGVCDNVAASAFFENVATSDKRIRTYAGSLHSLEYGRERVSFLNDYAEWLERQDGVTSSGVA